MNCLGKCKETKEINPNQDRLDCDSGRQTLSRYLGQRGWQGPTLPGRDGARTGSSAGRRAVARQERMGWAGIRRPAKSVCGPQSRETRVSATARSVRVCGPPRSQRDSRPSGCLQPADCPRTLKRKQSLHSFPYSCVNSFRKEFLSANPMPDTW